MKYEPAECPILLYPADASDRRAWLKYRDWRLIPHTAQMPERWSHPDIPGLTFSRNGALRVQMGMSMPEDEAQDAPKSKMQRPSLIPPPKTPR